MYPEIPIPEIKNDSFKKKEIEIRECHEVLLPIRTLNSKIIKSTPKYFQQNMKGALADCYLREGVISLLEDAAELLPEGYSFVVWDGWRPFEVQKYLFDSYYEKISAANPGISKEVLNELTSKYVSYPSKNLKSPAPHITGGSVDLTIMNDKGNLLDFGTEFDDFSEKAKSRYYEEKVEAGFILDEKETEILKNRRLLFHIMDQVGFSNYDEEWWHYDYGNQWWAQLKNKQFAKYGLIPKVN